MIEYELFYLVGESREHDLDKIKKEVDEVVSGEGGKILEVEVVTRRKMSYEIKKESRGVYVAKRFEILDKDEREEKDIPNKDIVAEINTKLLQNRDILRFIITRADQLPELKAETKKEEKSGQPRQNFRREEAKREIAKTEKVEKKEEVKEEKKEEAVVSPEVEAPIKKKASVKKVEKEEKSDKIEEKKEKKNEKKVSDKKKKTVKENDIDKKLDEILNI